MTHTAVIAPRPLTQRASLAASIAATLTGVVLLIAPALWNRYPLLQYDTGGYLARWYQSYLIPSRSTVFGIYLHFGEGLHFWPQLVLQSLCAIWIVSLVLRVTGFGRSPWRTAAMVGALSLVTGLPFLSSSLLTDIFAGLSVLALHLMIFHRPDLSRLERIGLFVLVAFGAASHSATLAVLLAIWAVAVVLRKLLGLRLRERLIPAGGAIASGAAMLLAANFALSGHLAWTPGGYGLVFGRMMQDGIVKRYLDDHCRQRYIKLCPYRNKLPATADMFFWGDGFFNDLGGFDGLGDEMRFIVVQSIEEYPLQQVETAVAATATQLRLNATGFGLNNEIWHTYEVIKRYVHAEVQAMQNARQQHGELGFDLINRVHVPIALGSMLLMLALLVRAPFYRRFDATTALAATVAVAVLANAAVCGVLSGPHDRYGSRIVWIATLAVAVALAHAFERRRSRVTGKLMVASSSDP
jgi:hypothetical protein